MKLCKIGKVAEVGKAGELGKIGKVVNVGQLGDIYVTLAKIWKVQSRRIRGVSLTLLKLWKSRKVAIFDFNLGDLCDIGFSRLGMVM